MKITRFLGLCTALMLSILCIGSAQASIISDLVGYWSTDTNGDYKDYSNRAHTILNYGSSVFNTTGKVNGGYTYINGGVQTQAAQAGNTSDFEFGTGDYSIATWVKFNIDPAATATAIVSRLNYSSTNGFGLVVETSNFKFYQANYTLGTYLDSGINPVAGTWYFVAVVRNGTNTSIWINNTLAASATITQSASTTNTSKNLSIGGSDYGTWNKPSSATIDEIGLWKGYTLSAAEINCLYNSGNGRNYTQLATICQMGNFTIYQVNDYYNGTQILSYNATINGTLYSTTNGVINTNISSMENINVSLVANNYLGNVSMNWNASQALSAVLVPYTQIRASSYLGGSPGGILNFAINYTAYGNTSDTGTTTTTNGLAHIPLYNDVYNVIIYDANNASTNYGSTNASLTANTYLHSYNFTLYLSNTINFIFRDEDTNALLNNTTVYAYITGTIGSYNFTTTNGTYNISLILPQVYVITYNAVNYSQRTYYYTLTNQSSTTLTLYLLNSANGTVSLWNAVDTINRRAVPGDEMHVQRKNLSGTNYYTVEICTTDANGECVVTVELVSNTNKPTYRVLHYYGGSLVLNSGDTTFTSNVKTWEINIESRPLAQLFQVTGAYYNLSENHSTTAVTFNYTFVDTYSAINNNCMIVTSINYGASTTLYSNCTTNDNDAMITTHAFTGQQVCARTYATTTNGQTYGTGNIICLVNTQNDSNTGAKGLFYIVLPVFITFIMIFRSRPGLAIMGGGAVLATTYFIGLLDTTSVVIGGVLVLFATIYLANKT